MPHLPPLARSVICVYRISRSHPLAIVTNWKILHANEQPHALCLLDVQAELSWSTAGNELRIPTDSAFVYLQTSLWLPHTVNNHFLKPV